MLFITKLYREYKNMIICNFHCWKQNFDAWCVLNKLPRMKYGIYIKLKLKLEHLRQYSRILSRGKLSHVGRGNSSLFPCAKDSFVNVTDISVTDASQMLLLFFWHAPNMSDCDWGLAHMAVYFAAVKSKASTNSWYLIYCVFCSRELFQSRHIVATHSFENLIAYYPRLMHPKKLFV
jgi:hypothetical protein